jgi:putative phosphoribosyl transferase
VRFRDREEAGRELAALLGRYRDEQPLVLGLPRGGVPVAEQVARALGAPLDVFLVRKLGAPFQPELGIGALAEGGVLVLDERAARLGIDPAAVEAVRVREAAELERRVRAFRGGRPPPPVAGRTVIVVDDGIATGVTVRAAVRALRQLGAGRVVVATPVAAPESLALIEGEADEVVVVEAPDDLWAIGAWYADFRQLSDEEVMAGLDRARAAGAAARPAAGAAAQGVAASAVDAPRAPTVAAAGGERAVSVEAGGVLLRGDLAIPDGAQGIVVFAHGSGSGRHSPRNRRVARVLQDAGLATLLLDLLTEDEERVDVVTGELRFDIDLLGDRVVGVIDWLVIEPATRELHIGCFGSSTGAAAALVAAAERPETVAAVVSRGGRPDLALPVLHLVRAPTLLVVGGNDYPVIDMNREALARLRCEKRLVIVSGATHLFEEAGTLDEVARLAAGWFRAHLQPTGYEAHP